MPLSTDASHWKNHRGVQCAFLLTLNESNVGDVSLSLAIRTMSKLNDSWMNDHRSYLNVLYSTLQRRFYMEIQSHTWWINTPTLSPYLTLSVRNTPLSLHPSPVLVTIPHTPLDLDPCTVCPCHSIWVVMADSTSGDQLTPSLISVPDSSVHHIPQPDLKHLLSLKSPLTNMSLTLKMLTYVCIYHGEQRVLFNLKSP